MRTSRCVSNSPPYVVNWTANKETIRSVTLGLRPGCVSTCKNSLKLSKTEHAKKEKKENGGILVLRYQMPTKVIKGEKIRFYFYYLFLKLVVRGTLVSIVLSVNLL